MAAKPTSAELDSPESFYTQTVPPPPPPPLQHPDETPLPDYDIPAYNPAAPQYAHHQGYAFPPPPTQPTGSDTNNNNNSSSSSSNSGSASGHHRLGLADRLSALGAKAASPINMLANKMGSEGFLPAAMDKECDKAARVLKGFCKHGIYAETPATTSPSPSPAGADGRTSPAPRKNRTLVTIPAKVLQKAVGLAIFTTGRVGFHVSGATGSGVLLARRADGSWSPPSGIQVHSVGAGFVMGADIYDCVLVLNTPEALDAFRNTRLSLGSDLAVVAGPYGAGGSVDVAAAASAKQAKLAPQTTATASATATATATATAVGVPTAQNSTTAPVPPPAPPSPRPKAPGLRQKASFAYIKSRGIYAGVTVDGTVVTQRAAANAAFYGAPVSVDRILRGDLPNPPVAGTSASWHAPVDALLAVVRAAEAAAVQPPLPPRPSQQQPSPSLPQNQREASPDVAWANAAPATVVDPGTSTYPTAPAVSQSASDGHDAAAAAAPPSKADEAAAEAAAARAAATAASPPPPGYSEIPGVVNDGPANIGLPPAYVDDGQTHTGTGDAKTGH